MMSHLSDAPRSEHVIICGLGHVGYRVARLMVRLGQGGAVITREVNEDWRRAIEPQFCVIVGDAQDDRVLDQAGIASAKAVIIVTNDDLANVSIALDARRMNPRAALIVRQFDQELAVYLEQSAGLDRALSTSALAAPSFVAAALGKSVRCTFAVGAELGYVSEDYIAVGSPYEGRSLGEWSAGTGQAVLAVCRGEEVVLPCPLETPILPGDRVVALHLTDGPSKPEAPATRSRGSRLGISAFRRFWLGIRHWWHDVPPAMRAAMLALLLIVLASVVVFHVASGLSWIDALYFVVTTITTVGYGDYHLMNAPPALKLYGVFVMLCGAALLAMVVSVATDVILRTRLRDMMAHSAAHYRGHIIVAGLGSIGFRLVRDLVQAGEIVVAIEHRADAPFVQAARELAPVVLGNAKTAETLRKAGAVGAKAVVAATDDDLTNLSMVLAAKRTQRSCRAVLRLFNAELADKMQQGLAMDAVLSVSAAAAPTFVAAALCPNLLHGFLLGDWMLAVYHEAVGDECRQPGSLAGTLDECQSVLFLQRNGTRRFEFATGRVPQPGDKVLGVRWYRLAEKRGHP
jgi:Trk K+ transport system NAD-binding subunit